MPYPARIDPASIGERALKIVEEKGWDHWSLRDVASALGVTPNALYRHVGDRAGLGIAIGAAACAALAGALETRDDSPLERVLAMSHRYVDFGTARPDAYRAFVDAKPDVTHPGIRQWMLLWDMVRQVVVEAVPDAGDAAGFALWAFLHGRVMLAQGPARAAAPNAGLDDAVRALLSGFRAMGDVPSPLPPYLARG
ncbi:MAG: TetR/AcrR family transcriptional regulator [Myxococcota bacterium]